MSNGSRPTTVEDITVHCCISAVGTMSLLFIIYLCFLPSVTYALHGPTDSIYSEKGIMTLELFLDHFVKHALAA